MDQSWMMTMSSFLFKSGSTVLYLYLVWGSNIEAASATSYQVALSNMASEGCCLKEALATSPCLSVFSCFLTLLNLDKFVWLHLLVTLFAAQQSVCIRALNSIQPSTSYSHWRRSQPCFEIASLRPVCAGRSLHRQFIRNVRALIPISLVEMPILRLR